MKENLDSPVKPENDDEKEENDEKGLFQGSHLSGVIGGASPLYLKRWAGGVNLP